MKKLFFAAVALLFAASFVMAQTPEEQQASANRVAILKGAAPKACGIKEIDDAVAKSKTVADATVGVSEVTAALSGDAAAIDFVSLSAKIQSASKGLGEIGSMMSSAADALKNLKNPMKIKPATKAMDYVTSVTTVAGEELPYQGKVVAALVKK